jgi:indolepyruvate decarboxylase
VFGCRGWEVGTYAELTEAVTGAFKNSDSPSIIQVRVPDKSIPANANWKTN